MTKNIEEHRKEQDKKTLHAVIREMGVEIKETEELIDRLNRKLRDTKDNKRRLEMAVDNVLDEENY